MKNLKLMMVSLIMKKIMILMLLTGLTKFTFGQQFSTSKCSADPVSKQNTINWTFSDSLVNYEYTHPKMIKFLNEYGGNVKNKLIISEIKIVSEKQKIFYATQIGDVKCRITVTHDLKNNSHIVTYETFDSFSNSWTKSIFYN